jgi:hypothetical protein
MVELSNVWKIIFNVCERDVLWRDSERDCVKMNKWEYEYDCEGIKQILKHNQYCGERS